MKKIISIALVTLMIMAAGIPILNILGNGDQIKASAEESKTSLTADSFIDVPKNAWYYGAVDFVVKQGIFSGTSSNEFEPNSNMTRAMFVKMLANFEGVDLSSYTTTPFEDVNIAAWYGPAIAWAYANNLVKGTTTTTFLRKKISPVSKCVC